MYNAEVHSGTDIVRNEISFTNLFEAASNDRIFSALDKETQEKLIKILCAYTKANVDKILEFDFSSYQDLYEIERRM